MYWSGMWHRLPCTPMLLLCSQLPIFFFCWNFEFSKYIGHLTGERGLSVVSGWLWIILPFPLFWGWYFLFFCHRWSVWPYRCVIASSHWWIASSNKSKNAFENKIMVFGSHFWVLLMKSRLMLHSSIICLCWFLYSMHISSRHVGKFSKCS